MKAEQFDKKFDDNESEIIEDIDLSSMKRLIVIQKGGISWVVTSLDKGASRIGVTRQSIINMVS